MQKEQEEEKEEGKHRGGLFQAEVVSLRGLCTCLGQSLRSKNTGLPFPELQHKAEEQSASKTQRKTLRFWKQSGFRKVHKKKGKVSSNKISPFLHILPFPSPSACVLSFYSLSMNLSFSQHSQACNRAPIV